MSLTSFTSQTVLALTSSCLTSGMDCPIILSLLLFIWSVASVSSFGLVSSTFSSFGDSGAVSGIVSDVLASSFFLLLQSVVLILLPKLSASLLTRVS